jgi:hypothetical protein
VKRLHDLERPVIHLVLIEQILAPHTRHRRRLHAMSKYGVPNVETDRHEGFGPDIELHHPARQLSSHALPESGGKLRCTNLHFDDHVSLF